MSQIKRKFIANNAVDGTKIRLENNQAFKTLDSASMDRTLFYFSSANELRFSEIPKVVSNPQVADDLVRKAYVDQEISSAVSAEQVLREAAVLAEQTAREAADANLQTQINNILSNTDPAALDSLAEVVAAFQAADGNLNDAISALGTGSSSALAQEISDRIAGDAALQSSLDQEVLDRQAAVSAEASARAAAVSAEQSARIAADAAEQSARIAADAAEQSARIAADALLQSNLDAKTLDALANVVTSSKTDGQLLEWDSATSKWINVSPLTEASVASVTPVSSSQAIAPTASSLANTTGVQGGGGRRGQTFTVESNVYLDSIEFAFSRSGGQGAVDNSQQFKAFVFEYDTTKAPVLADAIASSNTFMAVDILYFAVTPKQLQFSPPVLLNSSKTYVVFVSDPAFVASDLIGISYFNSTTSTYAGGQQVGYSYTANSWSTFPSQDLRMTINYLSSLPTQLQTGVIKTNASGLLDESFLEYDVNFGGHKLQGVSTPVADTDAVNKKYVDDEVAAEEAARIAAVAAEASARQAADSAEAAARAAADSAEASARQAADSALDARLDVIEGSGAGSLAKALQDAKDYADSLNAAQTSERIDADTNLQNQIFSIISNTDPAALDSLAEVVAAFQAADSNLNDAISALGTGSSSALGQEISDRQAADAALQAEIDAEESRALAAESALQSSLNQEISDRQAADSAEASARQAADAAEASARQAADAAETAAREASLPRYAKHASTLGAGESYKDLSHKAVDESLNVFIDRLALHANDDYTVSTSPSGHTRITFTGSFMSSEEGPAAGDLFRCSYAYKNSDQPAVPPPGGAGGGAGAGAGGSSADDAWAALGQWTVGQTGPQQVQIVRAMMPAGAEPTSPMGYMVELYDEASPVSPVTGIKSPIASRPYMLAQQMGGAKVWSFDFSANPPVGQLQAGHTYRARLVNTTSGTTIVVVQDFAGFTA